MIAVIDKWSARECCYTCGLFCGRGSAGVFMIARDVALR